MHLSERHSYGMMLVGLFLMVVGLSTSVFCLGIWLKTNQLTNLTQSLHPVIMPFKGDQHGCEANGYVWEDETCVDYTYDPAL